MISKPIDIGGKLVGPGCRPLVIAEISANHLGSLDRALAIVRSASDNGADAIKLQTFTPSTLTIDSHRPEFFIDDPGSLWHGRRLWDLYDEAHTPWEWHQPLFEAARARGLARISTAFDVDSVEFLLSLKVDALKIASFELVHIPLIEKAARTGRPVLLSSGMSTADEVDDAVAALRRGGCSEFILLKCTSSYPLAEADANVLGMSQMRERYQCAVGFSDHTLTPYAAFAATSHGAAVIEKHFTLARSDGGVDAEFSIEPAELRELARGIELVWKSLGRPAFGPLHAETASVKERPSIYVVKAMRAGETFTESNIRVIRPARGLAPRFYGALLGRTAATDIAAESPLTWNHVANANGEGGKERA